MDYLVAIRRLARPIVSEDRWKTRSRVQFCIILGISTERYIRYRYAIRTIRDLRIINLALTSLLRIISPV